MHIAGFAVMILILSGGFIVMSAAAFRRIKVQKVQKLMSLLFLIASFASIIYMSLTASAGFGLLEKVMYMLWTFITVIFLIAVSISQEYMYLDDLNEINR